MSVKHRALAAGLGAAASAFLESLSSDQRDRATFGFPEDEQRRDWAYFPRNHAGLPLHNMDRSQQKLAHVLLSTGLSLSAYARVTSIIGLESVLNLLEGRRMDAVRDPGRYFVSVFGEPGVASWGYRIEGHHVCLNYTLVDGGLVSATPIFLGANPASVSHGDVDVVRPCAEEEDLGRELLLSLDDDQRRLAVLADTAPPDFVLANSPFVPEACMPGDVGTLPQIMQRIGDVPAEARAAVAFERAVPKGLAVAKMSPDQTSLLRRLVSVYVERLPGGAAEEEMARLEPSFASLHFAWAGGSGRREGHYYRIQGGTFLIEYDNTQNDANHVHAVWRDAVRDFGDDVLRRHVAQSHT
ncbi:MAG: DUF3500 domain-containing protein [Dehalococcoidia bacterium]